MKRQLQIHQNLHVLICEDKEGIVAHCLEMDICGQGNTKKEAVNDLIGAIRTQIDYCVENDMVDTIFRPAPKEYWDKFYNSQIIGLKGIAADHKLNVKELVSNLEVAYA